jgi:diadenosine tetraphosphatase ApaH/serine/threonine PP2A family protein phosphatase
VRTLLLSDLHANLEASLAVLDAARPLGYDRLVVLGDLVGYGGSPEEVVRLVRDRRPIAVIRGNHDRVVAGIDSGEEFNLLALQAALVNRRALSAESREYLAALPAGPRALPEGFAIAHGTPRDEDEYLVDAGAAAEVFREAEFRICFIGHTHIPCLFSREGETVRSRFPVREGEVRLDPACRYLINPGSVGQPRDEDPRAAFALFDDGAGTITFHRAAYPIERAQERILAAGIPPLLAERLARGV